MTAVIDLLPNIRIAIIFGHVDAIPGIVDLETETDRSGVAAHLAVCAFVVKPVQLLASFAQFGFGHAVVAPVLTALETAAGYTANHAQSEGGGNDAERWELHF